MISSLVRRECLYILVLQGCPENSGCLQAIACQRLRNAMVL
jgi:hypothetical protein